MNKYPKGLVLGKFMPLHLGHEYLLRFARQYCEELTVVVDCLEQQTISVGTRVKWISELGLGENVKIVGLERSTPQSPEETPLFWDIWKQTLYQAMGGKPDVLVAAMDYGWPLSHALECAFVQCDIERESIPVSATLIRENPMAHWEFIAAPARPYFLRKVAFMGPESAGKSTCASNLAKALGTVYVPEYAKAVIVAQHGNFYEKNVEEVAFGQHRSERALACMSNRLQVCDTNVLTTLVWSEYLFGGHPPSLEALVEASGYDRIFLFDPSLPWVPDVHRNVLSSSCSSSERMRFFDLCQHWLTHFGLNYDVVSGSHESRFDYCLAQSKALISA